MTEPELRLQLLKDVLASCAEAYRENVRIGAVLEDKAQKAGAFAGLFLAAAFGFARRENLADMFALVGGYGMSLMILCVMCFLFCVFAGLWVMWVRPSRGPLDPAQLSRVGKALLSSPEPLVGEKSENHIRDQIDGWLLVLDTQRAVNAKKARRLLIGQWILAGGIVLLVVLLVLLTTHVTTVHGPAASIVQEGSP